MVGNASGCFKNGIILTSLSRNFFTDLRKASVDMPKRSLQAQLANLQTTFFFTFYLKKSLGKEPQSDGQR